MLSYLKDGEVGLRGYLLLKDEKYLLPYLTSEKKVDSVYRIVRSEVSDNAIQVDRANYLHLMFARKYQNISDQLRLFRDSHLVLTDSIKTKEAESKQLMDSIRFVAGTMELREDELLGQRTEGVTHFNNIVNTIIVISLTTALLVALYAVITYNLENRAKKAATTIADSYHEQLEKRVEELNQANRELYELRSLEKFAVTGRIARTIAHEVRNPLTNIELAADQLNSDQIQPDEEQTLLGMISRNSKRINSLITDLLNATKFSELSYQKTSINELMDDALKLATDRASLKKIEIRKDYSRNIPLVSVDPERIKIAVLNIIVNAVEAVPAETGQIFLETSWQNGTCLITIADNGPGMDDETTTKIFDPYYTSKMKGNGLGLTNSQSIVLNHGGKIQVHSELGKGSRFRIILPREEKIPVNENPA
jgi:signal transduction histidine kinase